MGERTNPRANFVAGGFGGLCRRLVQQPFDTIKVRMQSTSAGRPKLYNGSFDCFLKTLSKEGIRGLYKGMTVVILSDAPLSALFFFGASIGRRLQMSDRNSEESIRAFFLAGCLGSSMTSVIVIPVERVKVLLQVEQRRSIGPVHIGKELWKSGGLRAFYRGTLATLCRDIPCGGTYLGIYEWTKRHLRSFNFAPHQSHGSLSLFPTIIAGGVAGLIAAALGMPSDVIKSRMQSAPDHYYPHGMRCVAKELLQKGGVTAFYRGFTPIAVYAFPGSAACMVGYELALDVLLKFSSVRSVRD